MLANGIAKLDGVFWTHDHADHCHGIDDLRVMRYGRATPIPGFAARGKQPTGCASGSIMCSPGNTAIRRSSNSKYSTGCGSSRALALGWCQMPHGGRSRAPRFASTSDGKVIWYADRISVILPMRWSTVFDGVDMLVTRLPAPRTASDTRASRHGARTGRSAAAPKRPC